MLLRQRPLWAYLGKAKFLNLRLTKCVRPHVRWITGLNKPGGTLRGNTGTLNLHQISLYHWDPERALTTKAHSLQRDGNIQADTVLLIDEDGSKIGEMKRHNALSLARSRALHVVQVKTTDRLSVCRLMSKAKIWEQEKQAKKKQRKSEAGSAQKELKMSSKIGDHDLSVKLKQIVRFMEEKRPVLVTVYTAGRVPDQRAAQQHRQNIMEKITTGVDGQGSIDGNIKFDARRGRALIFRLKPVTVRARDTVV